MKIHFPNDWIREKILADEDMPVEAGNPMTQPLATDELMKVMARSVSREMATQDGDGAGFHMMEREPDTYADDLANYDEYASALIKAALEAARREGFELVKIVYTPRPPQTMNVTVEEHEL